MGTIVSIVIVLAIIMPCAAFAQEGDDAWGEITNLMNAVNAGSAQLGEIGTDWMLMPQGLGEMTGDPQAAGVAALLNTFAGWCRTYAQGLEMIDAELGPEGSINAWNQLFNSFPVPQAGEGLPQMPMAAPDLSTLFQDGTAIGE